MTDLKVIGGGGMIIKFPGRASKRLNSAQRLRETLLASGISEVETAAACLIDLRTYRRREVGLPDSGGHRGLISSAQTHD
jgi:hypothetical protein